MRGDVGGSGFSGVRGSELRRGVRLKGQRDRCDEVLSQRDIALASLILPDSGNAWDGTTWRGTVLESVGQCGTVRDSAGQYEADLLGRPLHGTVAWWWWWCRSRFYGMAPPDAPTRRNSPRGSHRVPRASTSFARAEPLRLQPVGLPWDGTRYTAAGRSPPCSAGRCGAVRDGSVRAVRAVRAILGEDDAGRSGDGIRSTAAGRWLNCGTFGGTRRCGTVRDWAGCCGTKSGGLGRCGSVRDEVGRSGTARSGELGCVTEWDGAVRGKGGSGTDWN